MKRLLVLLLLVPLALALVLTLPGCFGPSAEQIMKDATKSDNDLVTVHFVSQSTQKLPRAPLANGKVQPQNYVQKSEGDIDLKTQNSKVKTELAVSYTHLRAHETDSYLVCRLLLEKK